MPANPTHLAAAQAVVAAFAREAMDNRLTLPGLEASAAELPAAVKRARAFYRSRLTPPDDSYGVVLVHQLPADMGSVLLVVGYSVESQWGAAEIYSPEGELWAAGVFVATAVGWHDVDTVRAAMVAINQPLALIPRAETLTWIPQDATGFVSAEGRFYIALPHPLGPPSRFSLGDGITGLTHECDTLEEARSLAAALLADTSATRSKKPDRRQRRSTPNRDAAGGNVVWKAESEAIEGGLRYRLFEKSKPMSYKDLVLAWRRDLAFCEFFSSVLAGSPFPAFRFELHPLAHHMVDDPCEFVLLESPELGSSFDRRDNSEGFAEWSFPVIDYPTLGILAVKRMFHRLSNPATRDDEETDEGTDEETDEETTRIQEASDPSYGRLPHIGNFVNVTNDAMLIVPSPQEAERVYAHLGVFLRETNERQRWEIWNMLGCDLAMWGAGIPLHVGTPAGGPPWVHLRVDRKPWLTYPPYRDYVPPALNSAPEAAPEPKKAPRKRASRPRKTKDG